MNHYHKLINVSLWVASMSPTAALGYTFGDRASDHGYPPGAVLPNLVDASRLVRPDLHAGSGRHGEVNEGGSFGSLSFGNVLPVRLEEGVVAGDLSAVGSLAGGGDLGEVDLVYVPEPAAPLMLAFAFVVALFQIRHAKRLDQPIPCNYEP